MQAVQRAERRGGRAAGLRQTTCCRSAASVAGRIDSVERPARDTDPRVGGAQLAAGRHRRGDAALRRSAARPRCALAGGTARGDRLGVSMAKGGDVIDAWARDVGRHGSACASAAGGHGDRSRWHDQPQRRSARSVNDCSCKALVEAVAIVLAVTLPRPLQMARRAWWWR
ncbi:MAG: hypothetical protein MZV65_02250 [Chromatiales bacterium]|nr:hypothetical protein [Chromatiales bacterium]